MNTNTNKPFNNVNNSNNNNINNLFDLNSPFSNIPSLNSNDDDIFYDTNSFFSKFKDGLGFLNSKFNSFFKTLFSKIFSFSLNVTSSLVGNVLSGITDVIFQALGKGEELLSKFGHVLVLISSFLDFLEETFSPFFKVNSSGLSACFGINFYRRLSVFLVNSYEFIKKFFKNINIGVAQSYESLAASLAFSYLLPPQLRGILKDFTLLSNFKLLDDTTLIHDIFDLIFDIPLSLFSLFCSEDTTSKLHSAVNRIRLLFPLGKVGKDIITLKTMCARYSKHVELSCDEEFQNLFLEVFPRFKSYVEDLKLSQTKIPNKVSGLFTQANKLNTKIQYVRSTSRKEPTFCVFVGPKGTGKTTIMNNLVSAYRKTNTVYVHSTHNADKDYYDTYDNESIFVCDDVGQKGVWQWSNFINMVGTTKFPLDAAFEAKGTKFFTSNLIMATTNNINLTLTSMCGISDLAALHRRMLLFDFSHVSFLKGKWVGSCHVKRYNVKLSQFLLESEINLDSSLKEFLPKFDSVIRNDMQDKINMLNNFDENIITLDALPQSFSSSLSLYFSEFKYLFSLCSDFILDNIINNPLYSFSFVSIVLISSYFLLSSYFSSIAPADVLEKTVPKYYQSARKEPIRLVDVVPESISTIFALPVDATPSPLIKLVNQTYGVKLQSCVGENVLSSEFVGVFSGRYFTGPFHNIVDHTHSYDNKQYFVTVYSSDKHVVYDHVEVKVMWKDERDDIVIYELPLYLPKYTSNIKFAPNTACTDMSLILPHGVKDLTKKVTRADFNIRYVKTHFKSTLRPEEFLLHEFNADSMCGSYVVTNDGFLLGHHVAMCNNNGTDYGIFKIFSRDTANNIKSYFSAKIDYLVEIDRSKIINGSAAVLKERNFSMPSTRTSIVPSLVDGIFQKERLPANFGKNPVDTIKTLSKAAFEECEMVDTYTLNSIIPEFEIMFEDFVPKIWSDSDIITGAGKLNRIDPKTSVGFGLTGNKTDYIDYEKMTFSDDFKKILNDFENDVSNGKYPDFKYVEQMKDELRNVGKEHKPRIFCMSPLVLTVLGRKYFGELMYHIEKHKFSNGIMVGINPLGKDWEKLVRNVIVNGDNVFDGDFEKWDKRMSPIFQRYLNKSLSKFLGESKIVCFLLESLIYTPQICVDTTIMTTHSLPSGAWITTHYNSMINKLYGMYCFYKIYFKNFNSFPSIGFFSNNVKYFVYGDDNLVGVSKEVREYFNGHTMSLCMKQIGLNYTPSDKVSEWLIPYKSIYSCSFLKRNFAFHRGIGRIVAPLELRSMKSTLNYVKDNFRNDELTVEKLLNFQREAYLHENLYDHFIKHVKTFCDDVDLIIPFLSADLVRDVHLRGDAESLLDLN